MDSSETAPFWRAFSPNPMIRLHGRTRVSTRCAGPNIGVLVLLLMFSVPLLGGCGASRPHLPPLSQVYLHSDDTEKATQKAKDDFGKIQVAQYFSAQQKEFATFAGQEDAAVTEYLIELRNLNFAELLRENPLATSDSDSTQKAEQGRGSARHENLQLSNLRSAVNDNLKKITGLNVADEKNLNLLREAPRDFQREQVSQCGC